MADRKQISNVVSAEFRSGVSLMLLLVSYCDIVINILLHAKMIYLKQENDSKILIFDSALECQILKIKKKKIIN